MKYIVGVKEVHLSYRKVEADSSEEAIKLAGDAKEFNFDYHSTLEPSTWLVMVESKNKTCGRRR